MTALLTRCLAGSVLVGVTALLRAALRRRLPRGTFVVLWWVALARLLLPAACPSALSVYALLAHADPAAVSLPAAGLPAVPAALPAITGGAEAAAQTASALSPWAVVWAAGSALTALWFLTAYVRCRRRFAASVPAEDPALRRWLEAHRLRRPLSIRQSGTVDAPLTYGLLRPVILLPAAAQWDGGMDFVLAHELVHIRRFDGLARLALAAALCLYWWNPAVWLLYVLAGRDLELSCDEAVVRGAGGDIRRAYAQVLISMEARKSGLSPALYSRFGGSAMEERIVSIMKYKKATVLSLLLAVLLVAGVTTAFATSPRTAGAASAAPRDGESTPAALVSVSRGDEQSYTPGQWAEIQEQVRAGEVLLFDTKEAELAYAALSAFETPDYRSQTVAAFNTALVPDRDALGQRLDDYILVRDAGVTNEFLARTLWQSLSERYGDYLEPDEPYFCPVYLMQPEREDAFAAADVYLFYTLPDPSAVTVGERDDALRNIRMALQTYFDGLTDEELADSGLPQRMQAQCTALCGRFAPAGMPMTAELYRLEGSIGGEEILFTAESQ
ncbi:MAG: M56 family metallopeptidase [Oscillospiraceae bacterium]|nr:M56 family metallopeptidase [Oscillospiraceae bacterium]